MKIAIVHDYIKEYGGAERVLKELCNIYPDAEIYTSVYVPKFLGPHKNDFKDRRIHTSFLQLIPFKAKLISPFRIISPLAFKTFDFSSYDLIIASQTGAYFPNSINKGHCKLITYTHTPPRYLYGYMTARNWQKNKLTRVIGEVINHFLRIEDYHSSRNVDQFITNSNEVAKRIMKFYRREAVVVYPPVDLPKIRDVKKSSYYLAGGRLARAKGMDVIVEAFAKMDKPLKIFGKGFAGYERYLKAQCKKLKASNIEFLGEVNDEEKFRLMSEAKAYIFASYDEDFGITPVEAMGVGTPVIAYKSGGVKETVLDGKTGVFYEENKPENLIKAVERFEKLSIKDEVCTKQAEKFGVANFRKGIKKEIEKVLS